VTFRIAKRHGSGVGLKLENDLVVVFIDLALLQTGSLDRVAEFHLKVEQVFVSPEGEFLKLLLRNSSGERFQNHARRNTY
jgi:hypothetical protein